MRITQNTIFNTLRSQISANGARLMQAQERMATQKQFNRLSENPVDGGRVLDLKSAQARATQYLRNIDRTSSLAAVQDTTLSQVETILGRVKELVLQESNDASSTVATREAVRIEIASLTGQLMQTANTRFDGKYIFSGTATDQPTIADASVAVTPAVIAGRAAVTGQSVTDPTQQSAHTFEIRFTAPATYDIVDTATGATTISGAAYTSGQAIKISGMEVTLTNSPNPPAAGDTYTVTPTLPGAYQGNSQVQRIEIQPDTQVIANIPGDRLFAGAGLSGGVDIFATLNGINKALADNDRTTLRGFIDTTEAAREQVTVERTRVGARVNLLDQVKSRQEDIELNLETLRSSLEDADIAETMTELSRQQNTYEATLMAGSQIVTPSLMDFLR